MKIKRTVPLISGSTANLFLGVIYAWSIFVTPLETEFNWTRMETSGTFTISMIFFCVGGIVSGMLLRKKSPKLILIISALCFLVGFTGASCVSSIAELYLTYGVFCGLGVGLAYNVNLSTVTKWFPDKIGLTLGILLMCFGCGGMALGSVATFLIGAMGWRITFRALGISSAVILLICSMGIKAPGDGAALPERKVKTLKAEEEGSEMTTAEMMKRIPFWLQFIWAVILTAAGLSVIGHAAVFAQDMGATITYAAVIIGTMSICNGLGRIISGYAFDNFGRKISAAMANSLMVTAFAILLYAVWTGNTRILLIGSLVLGLAYGCLPTINSAFVNLFYGTKNYALNLSIINSNIIPGAIIGPLAAGAVKTATGSYLGVLALFLTLSILAYIMQLFVKRP